MRRFKYSIALSIIGLLISGCASTNENILAIQKHKQNEIKKQIKISYDGGYEAYIDKDNNLKFICMSNKCNYYSYKKHSYFYKTPEEEIILFNSQGYYPPISPNTKDVKCGTGSIWGWLAIFSIKPFGIRNYSKFHPRICYSRFTKIDSTLIPARVFWGFFTFMTPLITGGTLHTRKFDKEEFINAIYESNLETFRQKLINIGYRYNINGIDVIYLEEGDIEDSLENKYESLLTDKSLKSGVIFLDKDTKRLLTIDIFDKYKNKTLLESISLQINDILNNIAKNNQYILKYEDILPYIPPKVKLPVIPPAKKIVKDEFETKAEFQKRVLELVRKREEKIRQLQREYSLAVFERNEYIKNLQKAYEKYLENEIKKKNKLLKEIKENIPLLTKVLFLENISGYNANNFRYDAETQKLYFTIYSNRNNFKQNVVSTIPPNIAKKIKLQHSFKIIPDISAKNNKLILKGFKILEPQSNNIYQVYYTNKNYTPEMITLRIKGMKESIKKEISTYFKKFKQKDMPIVDTSKKEIWYIDVVNTINAKIPKWFSHPEQDKIIGYGEGKTLEEAMANARKELAYMIKVKIHSKFESVKQISDFKSFNEVKESIKQATDIKLNADDYTIYRQEKIDGIWYVGLKYKPKTAL